MAKKKCDYCDAIFEGVNEEHVNSQLLSHKIFKHKNLIKIVEKKDAEKGNT